MKTRDLWGRAALIVSLAFASQAGVVLDVNFSELSMGIITNGQGILDSSGNGYHMTLTSGDAATPFTVMTNGGSVHVENTGADNGGRFTLNPGTTNAAWAGTTPTPSIVLDAAKSYTFEAVIKPHPYYEGRRQGLMGTTGASEFYWRVNDGVMAYVFKDTAGLQINNWSVDASSYFSDGQFHNFTLILDRDYNEVRVYVDGTLLNNTGFASIASLTDVLDGTEEFRLGSYNTINSLYGISDRYRISDEALAPAAFLTAPATVPADTTAPVPNPASLTAASDGETSIKLTATTGLDATGYVEYLFTETSGNPGATSSAWTTNAVYIDSGLTTGTQYVYTVTMRDSLGNTGTASEPASAIPVRPTPGNVVNIDFEHFAAGSTIEWGERIQDTSGNGYHGMLGTTESGGIYDIITTTNYFIGLDTSTKTKGLVLLYDGMNNVPGSWDGPTTTISPYFTLEAAKNYTFEMAVKFASTDPATAGVNALMGQTGSREAWIRANGSSLQYNFNTPDGAANKWDLDISSLYDGEFHTIAIVLDRTGGEIRTYLDGVLAHTNTDADIPTIGEMLDGTADFRFGGYNADTSNHFKGVADLYRITSYALDPSEFYSFERTEPLSSAVLSIEGGAGSVTVTASNLTFWANSTLQSRDSLNSETWSDISSVIGVTETNWVMPSSSAAFFRVETSR